MTVCIVGEGLVWWSSGQTCMGFCGRWVETIKLHRGWYLKSCGTKPKPSFNGGSFVYIYD
jgi:hypothetical protein